jgi:hypothetical protein
MKMAFANGGHVAMVTTKDIREGDEIFLSYMYGYGSGYTIVWSNGNLE